MLICVVARAVRLMRLQVHSGDAADIADAGKLRNMSCDSHCEVCGSYDRLKPSNIVQVEAELEQACCMKSLLLYVQVSLLVRVCMNLGPPRDLQRFCGLRSNNAFSEKAALMFCNDKHVCLCKRLHKLSRPSWLRSPQKTHVQMNSTDLALARRMRIAA